MVEIPDDIYRQIFEELAEEYNHISENQHFPKLSFDPFLAEAANFIVESHDFSLFYDPFIFIHYNNYDIIYNNKINTRLSLNLKKYLSINCSMTNFRKISITNDAEDTCQIAA